MTQWRNRYELQGAIAGAPRSFHGVNSNSSAPVVIHLLEAAGRGSIRAILIDLMSLPPEACEHVREIGEYEGAPYVVTDGHFGATAWEGWLKKARAFEDRYTRAGTWTLAAPQGPAHTVPDKAAESEPGEFTRMFASPLTAAPAAPPPEYGGGEITRLFQPESRSAPQGEFTRLIQMPAQAPAAPPNPPAVPAQEVGDFTRLLAVPAPARAADPPKTPVAVPAPPAPLAVGGPSDYTRVVSAAPRPSPVMEAPRPKPAVHRPSANTQMLVFCTLALVAVGLILFFALWR